jgi:cytochrome P450
MWLGQYGLYNSTFPAVPFAKKAIRNRLAKPIRTGEDIAQSRPREDLLSKFLKAKIQHPDIMTDKEVLGMCLSMIFAGSETT